MADKRNFFNNKPKPIGQSWVRRITLYHRDNTDGKAFEIVEQRKPWNARRYDRQDTDCVMLSVGEIEELYRISKGEIK